MKKAMKAVAGPLIGSSDHNVIYLLLAYGSIMVAVDAGEKGLWP